VSEPDSTRTRRECVTIKYTTDGDRAWVRTCRGEGDIYGVGIAVDIHGDVYVTGQSDGKYWITRYDENGNMIWNVVYDGLSSIVACAHSEHTGTWYPGLAGYMVSPLAEGRKKSYILMILEKIHGHTPNTKFEAGI